METQQPQKKGRIQRVKEIIHPPDPTKRIEDAYGILKEVGGLRPLFNIRDTEQRRKEIMEALGQITALEYHMNTTKDHLSVRHMQQSIATKSYRLAKLFELYFATGSPWIRGQDNEQLSTATANYIMNFEDVGDLPAALPDLHAESMYLLHLAWQGQDVTNTPGYIMSSTPVIMPQNIPRVDLGGKPATTEQSERTKHETL